LRWRPRAKGQCARRHGGGDSRPAGADPAANAEDTDRGEGAGATPAFLDRLRSTSGASAAMADALEVVRALADPVGTVTERWTRPKRHDIERVSVPIGVVGIIYKRAAPNVPPTRLALPQGGNAAILRGGSES